MQYPNRATSYYGLGGGHIDTHMHILTSALKWFKETRRVGLGAPGLAIHMSVCVWLLTVH